GRDQVGSTSGSASLKARRVLSCCLAISSASVVCLVFFCLVAATAGDAAKAAATSSKTIFLIDTPLFGSVVVSISNLIISHAGSSGTIALCLTAVAKSLGHHKTIPSYYTGWPLV